MKRLVIYKICSVLYIALTMGSVMFELDHYLILLNLQNYIENGKIKHTIFDNTMCEQNLLLETLANDMSTTEQNDFTFYEKEV